MNNLDRLISDLSLDTSSGLYIHGHAGCFYELFETTDARLGATNLLKNIQSRLKNCPIVIPRFSYSGHNTIFQPKKINGALGAFSEAFTVLDAFYESYNPILNTLISRNYHVSERNLLKKIDCFGKDSIFEQLCNDNFKVVFLGCDLRVATIVHHYEQCANVPYREVVELNRKSNSSNGNDIVEQKISYFSRKSNTSNWSYEKLWCILERERCLNKSSNFRLPYLSFDAKKVKSTLLPILKENPDALL